MRSERTTRCSASPGENPRSRKTLPLEGVILTLAVLRSIFFTSPLEQFTEPIPGNSDVTPECLPRSFRESVEHVNALGKRRDIEDTVFERGVQRESPGRQSR